MRIMVKADVRRRYDYAIVYIATDENINVGEKNKNKKNKKQTIT